MLLLYVEFPYAIIALIWNIHTQALLREEYL